MRRRALGLIVLATAWGCSGTGSATKETSADAGAAASNGSASGTPGSEGAGPSTSGADASSSGATSSSGSAAASSPPASSSGEGGAASSPASGPTGAACVLPAPSTTAPLASGAAVSATIHGDTIACTTASDFVGSNFEAFPMWGADVSFSAFQKASYSAAGLQMFRYPGGEPGEWSDLLFTGTCTDGSKANWASPSYLDLWTFAQSSGVGALLLQTNPTSQYCGPGSQDASGAHAAALAAAAKAAGVEARFEVGNEPEISSYFQSNGGESGYIAKFVEHASAIHTASPGAQVYGPALCGLGGNCSFPTSWDSGWLGTFLAATGNKSTAPGKGTVDGISFHVYWHPEWSYSDLAQAKIDKYGFGAYWTQTMTPYLRTLIAKYDTRDLPVAISEISIGDGIPGGTAQPQNMFTVLETLDTIGSFAISGLRSFQWFDANAAGPSDFGMITPSAARPQFYAFAAWSEMGPSLFAVDASANPHDVAIYASRRSDGGLAVVVVNKTASSHDVALTFAGASVAGKSATTTTLQPATAGSDASSSILYRGAADPPPTSLPAASVTMSTTAAPTITVPAYSATVVVYGS